MISFFLDSQFSLLNLLPAIGHTDTVCWCFTECRAQKDNVLQAKGEETAAAGGTVTLHCLYNSSGTSNYLFWYKQDGNNSPKFILSRYSGDDGNTAAEFKERFSSTLDSSNRSAPLKIQKLQLSDSAVYYCALQPTCKSELY
uniref:Ig-like domain-containing protein n=1 Tax=Maylandia zebra TaxID=106582 RepID=A0A3P9D9Z0_9CICH